MVLLRKEKVSLAQSYQEKLSQGSLLILHNKGMGAREMSDLRDLFFRSSINIVLLKRRMIAVILQKCGLDLSAVELRGSFFVCYASDATSMLKILDGFLQNLAEKKLDVFCGYDAEQNFLSEQDLQVLAKLPSKEVLLGRLATAVSSPTLGVMMMKLVIVRLACAIKFINNNNSLQ